ncbi:putative fatty acyl-CoA reductase CG5065 [Galendromus occidentalis]|uniref:Fatty acyl-CoA reductase n=1 Tax=Galendromus occidentalis TaxID=34638 RepID=A0AAJ6QUT2_9ACAR|nr:putative fatty acyl-CoA reductase CG5065 [Galendromus occidentalis]
MAAAAVASQNLSTESFGMAGYVSVREFYAGKTLFITGCTGFVGKVLLEKILRSCTEVRAIYVLGRAKRGQTLEQRFSEIFKSALFNKLQKDSPQVFTKVKYVDGDMLMDNLGLNDGDLSELQEHVNVVVHSAASVRFDAPLRDAVSMNLCGTKKLLDIARSFRRLEVFVHVSTCYANCDNDVVEERIYDSKYESARIMEMVEWLDDDAIDAVQDKLLAEKPNTYTFTKHLTEVMVQDYKKTVPFSITIVRPSIVVASMSEPFPGWVDNFNGPSGMICASACGFLRSIYSDRQMRTDLIPVDVVAKTIIIAAWRAGVTKSQEIEVYNCAIGDRAPSFTWGDFEGLQSDLAEKVIFDHAVRYPSLILRKNWTLHRASMLFEHYLPAYLWDKILLILGKQPQFMKVYEKLNAMQSALTFFTTHQWTFRTDNLERLSGYLSEQDRKEFNIDVSSLKWEEFLLDYVRGLRDFVLKETHKQPSTRFQRLYLVQQLQRVAVVFAVYKAFGVGEILSNAADAYF